MTCDDEIEETDEKGKQSDEVGGLDEGRRGSKDSKEDDESKENGEGADIEEARLVEEFEMVERPNKLERFP